MLMGSLATMSLQSQNLNDLCAEADRFKYIPEDEVFFYRSIVIKGIDKVFTVYWYDRNKDQEVQDDEVFIDINGDDIPDMILYDFMQWYKLEKDKKLLKETSG